MAFAIIAGITLKVTSMTEQTPIVAGDTVRAIDNTLLVDYRGEKKVWDIDGYFFSQADYEAFLAATDQWAEVAVSGDAFGAMSPLTGVVMSRSGDFIRNGASFDRSIRFQLEQA